MPLYATSYQSPAVKHVFTLDALLGSNVLRGQANQAQQIQYIHECGYIYFALSNRLLKVIVKDVSNHANNNVWLALQEMRFLGVLQFL